MFLWVHRWLSVPQLLTSSQASIYMLDHGTLSAFFRRLGSVAQLSSCEWELAPLSNLQLSGLWPPIVILWLTQGGERMNLFTDRVPAEASRLCVLCCTLLLASLLTSCHSDENINSLVGGIADCIVNGGYGRTWRYLGLVVFPASVLFFCLPPCIYLVLERSELPFIYNNLFVCNS